MNIIVCVNFLLDDSILTLDPLDGNRINKEDQVDMVHFSDLAAVEEAVRIKEKNGSGKVIVVAVAPSSQEHLLRRCLALGADEALCFEAPKNGQPDGYVIGEMMAKGCSGIDYDLILCGHGAIDNRGGHTGYVMAHLLDVPIVARVTKLNISEDQRILVVERRLERGYREQLKLPLPAMLTLEESINQPRYATFPNMIYARTKEINKLSISELSGSSVVSDIFRSKIELVDIKTPKARPKKIFTPDSSLSAEDRMWQIMSGGLDDKNRNKALFEGSPEELSQKFVEYLAQLEIVPFSAS